MDLIRFFAAVIVVFFHLSWKAADPQIGFAAGWVGVEIFFVISGFVIMGSAVGADVGTFVRKRFARLYPAATLCAMINMAFLAPFAGLATGYSLAVSASLRDFVASLLLIKGPFLVSALWTLPVEIGFYGLIGALIKRGWIAHPVRIAAALIVWSGLYLVPFCLSQYGLVSFTVAPLGYGLLNLTMLRHGCFFGVGILLWLTSRKGQGAVAYAMLIIGLVLCGVEIVARDAELQPEYAHAVAAGPLTAGALATFAVAVFGMWLFARINDILRIGAKKVAFLHVLGLITYPLYLMHEGVGGVTFSLLRVRGLDQGPALLAGLAVSLFASWIVVALFEPWLRPRMTALADKIVAQLRFS